MTPAPDGFTARQATRHDIDQIARPVRAVDHHDDGVVYEEWVDAH